jgi:hypothetical protein
MIMQRLTTIPLLLTLAASVQADPSAGGEVHWRAYVCRVTDWTDCEQNRDTRRIYPDPARYPDRNACLDGFGRRFESDPALKSKYPQTSDPAGSFVFDCEAVR